MVAGSGGIRGYSGPRVGIIEDGTCSRAPGNTVSGKGRKYSVAAMIWYQRGEGSSVVGLERTGVENNGRAKPSW